MLRNEIVTVNTLLTSTNITNLELFIPKEPQDNRRIKQTKEIYFFK